jgi:hypothetical protein
MIDACPSEDLLAGFLEGALQGEPLTRLEAHLLHCGECRKVVAASAGGAPAPPPFARGAQVGRYRIEGVVGAGGMGVVYAAHDPDLGRRIALKILREAPERTLIEARAMARLSHPNVVAVHDVLSIEGRTLIAMELIDGLTLRQWLRREQRGWREVLGVLLQAGRGVAAAHAAGVLHRDFKPDNVLVRRDGRAFVTDFGLARLSGDPAKGIAGSPAYMAPEQMLGAQAGERADLFAYCVTAHEALFGARPFAGSTPEEVLQAAQTQELREPPRKSPRRLRSAILRGLAADPLRRPPSMQALLAELERCERALRRRPAIAALAAAALLAAGAGLIEARAAAAARWRPTFAAMLPVYDEDATFPAWSPDGRWIAYASDRDGWPRLFVAPAAGGPPRALTPEGVHAVTPRWTRDGTAITFIDDEERVYRVPAQGGEPLLLAHGPRAFADCAGRLVLALRGDADCRGCALLVEHAAASDRRLWQLPSSSRFNDLRCDRDGKLLLVSRTDLGPGAETAALWLVPVDGGEPRRLTAGDGFDCNPTFHPDGRSVIFTRWRSGRADLWEVAADGSAEQQLTFTEEEDEQLGADVSPDGRQLVFVNARNGLDLVAWSGGVSRVVGKQLDSMTAIAVAPDGREIAANVRPFSAPERSSRLELLSLAGGERRVLDASGALPAYTVGGDLLYAVGESLWMQPRGGSAHKLADLPGLPSHVAAGPDAVWVSILSSVGGWALYAVPYDGGAPRRLSIPALAVKPAPRGGYTALEMLPGPLWEVRLVPPGRPLDQPSASVAGRYMAWDWDGTSLIHADAFRVLRYHLDTGRDELLFTTRQKGEGLAVSPDRATVYTLAPRDRGVRRIMTNFADRPGLSLLGR